MTKKLLDTISEHGTPFIAFLLGVFFLIAAFVKGAITRRHRLQREDSESANANGGTADAPVHLSDPFEEAEDNGNAPRENAEANAGGNAPAPKEASPEERYVWE